MKIAHVIHPVSVPATSDLQVAQPVTFHTMKLAREYANGEPEVELFAVKYADEQPEIPEWFTSLPDLGRSVADVASFRKRRKLAILKDILDRLHDASDADYFIYTNVDIAVQPYFYTVIAALIREGCDAFVINRRTVSDSHGAVEDIPLMCAEVGMTHPGHDCFVFKREHYPDYVLGEACIGTSWIGRVFITNLICNAEKFREFKDMHLTFHIGDKRVWNADSFLDYEMHNNDELIKVVDHYKAKGGFADHPMNRQTVEIIANNLRYYRAEAAKTETGRQREVSRQEEPPPPAAAAAGLGTRVKRTINGVLSRFGYVITRVPKRRSEGVNHVRWGGSRGPLSIFCAPSSSGGARNIDVPLAEPVERKLLSDDPVFVVGSPRSGTTLLQALLATQPGFVSFPETHFFEMLFAQRPLDAALRFRNDCMDEVLAEIGKWTELDFSTETRKRIHALAERRALDVKGLFEFIVHRFLADQLADQDPLICRWIEKTPFHVLYLPQILHLYPRAKIVAIIRHPVPVILSWRKLPKPSQKPVWHLARNWLRVMRVIDAFSRQRPESIHVLKYEDLVKDRDRVMSELCSFLGVELQADLLDNHHRVAGGIVQSWEPWKANVHTKAVFDANKAYKKRARLGDVLRIQDVALPEMKRRDYKVSHPLLQKIYTFQRRIRHGHNFF